MQISLYTLVTRDFSLEESLEMAVKAGFPAVDLRQGRTPEDTVHLSQTITDGEAEQVRSRVEAAGLHVSGLTTYYCLGKTKPEEARVELAGLRRGLALARILGARFVRCSGPRQDFGAPYEAARAALRAQVQEIGEEAAQAGVTITIEQHGGTLFASAGQILDLLRGVTNEYVGVVYDPGNCLSEGYETPKVQVDMLRGLIKAVHVKNGMTKSAEGPCECLPCDQVRLDQGLLSWPAIVGYLRGIGYENYLTLEDFCPTFGSVQEKLEWDAAYLRGLLAG